MLDQWIVKKNININEFPKKKVSNGGLLKKNQ
jgi:hypothetical protein